VNCRIAAEPTRQMVDLLLCTIQAIGGCVHPFIRPAAFLQQPDCLCVGVRVDRQDATHRDRFLNQIVAIELDLRPALDADQDDRPASPHYLDRIQDRLGCDWSYINPNIAVTLLSETEAESLCYLVNYRHDREEGDTSLPAAGDIPKFVGECRDGFRLTDEGWRFSSRKVELAFIRPSRRTPR
jgi:hypothetical protein